MNTSKDQILQSIREKVTRIIPTSAQVILFGSQARGDASDASDWDILILIDKERLEESDHDNYAYPLFELGWQINAQIHPVIYTMKDWSKRRYSPFYENVKKEGIRIC